MLTDTVAVVTGGANGIGRAIADTYAEHGADVVVADLESTPMDGGDPTVDLVEAHGQRGLFVETDVTDEASVSELAAVVDDEFDRLDVLVNNVGSSRGDAPVGDLELENWHAILDVCVTSAFLCTKHTLSMLLADGGGAVVNMSSTVGLQSTPGFAAYSASKAALTNLTRSLTVDYAEDGLRANSIHPSPVATAGLEAMLADPETGKLGKDDAVRDRGVRFVEPEEVADVALFLASDDSRFVNGEGIVVDGGLSATYY
jgi:NAD(P)-dependent dehydrogenase (short-subunit alcohol dehydrogenase family)